MKRNETSRETLIPELDPKYNVPTETLLTRFPIEYPTPAETDMARKIQNRMLNGFNTWNLGYEAWAHWGDVLYHPGSMYNVHGVRFTLREYQQAMNASLAATDIRMGAFKNMILSENWAAIRYETLNIDRRTGANTPADVTEFVRFADFGERGAKVEEGWGGTKCETFAAMSSFQTPEERAQERAYLDDLIATRLPETDHLEEKYPIRYPTAIDTERGRAMKQFVLEDFDRWNAGFDAWSAGADMLFAPNGDFDYQHQRGDLAVLKEAVRGDMQRQRMQRVRIDSLLVSADWAAVHFWEVTTRPDGKKDANNHMSFLHFAETDSGLQVDIACVR